MLGGQGNTELEEQPTFSSRHVLGWLMKYASEDFLLL
jgi:hypothetical protein